MDQLQPSDQEEPLLHSFCRAVADDLRLLSALHDREPEATVLEAMRKAPVGQQLAVTLRSEAAQMAFDALDSAITDLPAPIDSATVERLAAFYADIYLTHAYRAAPCESVWLDDDGLIQQEPMFQVRQWYRRAGVVVADPDKRPDDHVVHQLRFVAHLLASQSDEKGLREAARFLDEHLLLWFGRFCGRVARRCPDAYFAGLALLSGAYVEEIRDLISEVLGEPRPSIEETDGPDVTIGPPDLEIASPFLPGAAPGI